MRAECSPVTLHARPLCQEVTVLSTDVEHLSIILKFPYSIRILSIPMTWIKSITKTPWLEILIL